MNLSNLIRDAIKYQGVDAFDMRTATGGSSTTLVDSTLLEKYSDGDINDGTVLVVRTTDNLAPLDIWARISDYTEADWTATFAALVDYAANSCAIEAGDSCMIISPEFPIDVLVQLANDALRDCGQVTLTDTTLTTVADQKEYTLPAACRNLISVYVQTDNTQTSLDNAWVKLTNWRIVPALVGVQSTLIFDQAFDAGYTIQLAYNGFHPKVATYNDPISDMIPDPLAILVLADKIMSWYGVTDENQNAANKILSELNDAKHMYLIRRIKPDAHFLKWSS